MTRVAGVCTFLLFAASSGVAYAAKAASAPDAGGTVEAMLWAAFFLR